MSFTSLDTRWYTIGRSNHDLCVEASFMEGCGSISLAINGQPGAFECGSVSYENNAVQRYLKMKPETWQWLLNAAEQLGQTLLAMLDGNIHQEQRFQAQWGIEDDSLGYTVAIAKDGQIELYDAAINAEYGGVSINWLSLQKNKKEWGELAGVARIQQGRLGSIAKKNLQAQQMVRYQGIVSHFDSDTRVGHVVGDDGLFAFIHPASFSEDEKLPTLKAKTKIDFLLTEKDIPLAHDIHVIKAADKVKKSSK